jgi:hypothetical protein
MPSLGTGSLSPQGSKESNEGSIHTGLVACSVVISVTSVSSVVHFRY